MLSMIRHLALVDARSAADLAAVAEAIASATDALGIMPHELTHLLRPCPGDDATDRRWSRVVETRVRQIVGIATDVCALIGNPDEVRSWLRSPNPGLLSNEVRARHLTPIDAMLNYEHGIGVVRMQTRNEHCRRFPCAWIDTTHG